MIYKYALPVYFDGFTSVQTVDVSQKMLDAREGIWSVYSPESAEILGAIRVPSATQVEVTINPAPAEGQYLLIGLA